MQNKTVTSRKAETAYETFLNGESSSAIAIGEPICFKFGGTDDGIACVLPATGAGAKATTLFAGIVTKGAAAGFEGTAQVRGYNRYTKVIRMTRAATTDAWASYPAFAIGDRLVVDTVNNAMSRSDAGAVSAANGFCIVAETLASLTTAASGAITAFSAATVITQGIKTYLRVL